MVLLVVQFGLWLHAEHVVGAAATQALAAARVDGGTAQAGTDQAHVVLDQLGGGVDIVHVSVARDGDSVEVRIEGRCPQVVPFLAVPVTVRVAGPVERVAEPWESQR